MARDPGRPQVGAGRGARRARRRRARAHRSAVPAADPDFAGSSSNEPRGARDRALAPGRGAAAPQRQGRRGASRTRLPPRCWRSPARADDLRVSLERLADLQDELAALGKMDLQSSGSPTCRTSSHHSAGSRVRSRRSRCSARRSTSSPGRSRISRRRRARCRSSSVAAQSLPELVDQVRQVERIVAHMDERLDELMPTLERIASSARRSRTTSTSSARRSSGGPDRQPAPGRPPAARSPEPRWRALAAEQPRVARAPTISSTLSASARASAIGDARAPARARGGRGCRRRAAAARGCRGPPRAPRGGAAS